MDNRYIWQRLLGKTVKTSFYSIVFLFSINTFGQTGEAEDIKRFDPVWEHDFPDPTVIRAEDGQFYAYGTQTVFEGQRVHLQVADSKDGVNWKWLGEVLPDKPEWGKISERFWAPHVTFDKLNRRYVLYYAAQSDTGNRGMCIGVALSKTPEGPFRSLAQPLVCGNGFEAIDPMAFEDPKTGKHYLYWGSDSKPIMVRELSEDWIHFAPNSSARAVLTPDHDKDYDRLIEGPWVLFHNGFYYLFYSGDNCCGADAHYAVMVARSENPTGPFKRYSEVNHTHTSVILASDKQWKAPGHNSIVQDLEGNDWMYYHAISQQDFKNHKYARVMLRSLIRFKNGWPVVSGEPETDTGGGSSFTNPLLPSGADPWVTYKDGYYYYMNTLGNRLALWKTKDLGDLEHADEKTIWIPPETGPYSHEIWAPEIHLIEGKWYVYFAADDGKNENHRMYVIENKSEDPMNGEWVFKGKIADKTDKWAIDGSVFQLKKKWYFIWSGWEGDVNGQQNIYLAQMKNPWTIKGKRIKVSSPDQPWEQFGDLPGQTPDHVSVNEGPEILKHGGDVFLVYSANGCWTDHYLLGMLHLKNPRRVLKASSWVKIPHPVFQGNKDSSVYSPGHNSFFRSPDGRESWILYHANSKPHQGCGVYRSPRMQSYDWKEDGLPNFGAPVKTREKLSLPSGMK